MMLKFTQEIKDKWIKALKSGEYTQGFVSLYNKGNDTYCCLGVLADIHPELSNDNKKKNTPYVFLRKNGINVDIIWGENDNIHYQHACRDGEQKPDYSNVIPLIEQLPVKE